MKPFVAFAAVILHGLIAADARAQEAEPSLPGFAEGGGTKCVTAFGKTVPCPKNKADAVQDQTAQSCTITETAPVYSVVNGQNQVSGVQVVEGKVYHFGDLTIRLDDFESDGGIWHLEIKGPGYGAKWTLPTTKSIQFMMCGQSVTVRITGDFFVVSVF